MDFGLDNFFRRRKNYFLCSFFSGFFFGKKRRRRRKNKTDKVNDDDDDDDVATHAAAFGGIQFDAKKRTFVKTYNHVFHSQLLHRSRERHDGENRLKGTGADVRVAVGRRVSYYAFHFFLSLLFWHARDERWRRRPAEMSSRLRWTATHRGCECDSASGYSRALDVFTSTRTGYTGVYRPSPISRSRFTKI